MLHWLFEFIIRRREVVVLIFCLFISLLLMRIDETKQMQVVRVLKLSVFFPAEWMIHKTIHYRNVFRENKRLNDLVTNQAIDHALLKEAKIENDRLRLLLEFKNKSGFQLLPAEVIGLTPDRFLKSLIINIGTREGVLPNMPVVYSSGLVGKVKEAGPVSAIVQLITDPNCRVGCLVQRSRVIGILECEDGLNLNIADVLSYDDVQNGDVIVTSGLGGIFPKGILIGSAVIQTGSANDVFKRIEVKPSVDFNLIEEVFVLKKMAIWQSLTDPAVDSLAFKSLKAP